jgi:branched-subunit amino acid transport protein AzlD
MSVNSYALAAIAVIAAVTALLRFLPFIVFSGKNTPKYILWLGRVLPYAIMGMLVVYCLKGVSFTSSPYGIPELLCCVIVAALHVWKRSSILSIAGGTAVYMIIINFL